MPCARPTRWAYERMGWSPMWHFWRSAKKGDPAFFSISVRRHISGATKAHDWMVGALGPLFRVTGHTVRTQHVITAICGRPTTQQPGNPQLLSRSGGQQERRPVHHARPTCSRTVFYRIPRTSMRLCVLLRSAKLTAIRQQYADNQK